MEQALSSSCAPELREAYIKDARDYLRIAEERNGSVDAPLGAAEPWGAVIDLIRQEEAGHLIINLENAVTSDGEYWPDKGIHYRMHPANISVLEAAGVACCSLANNHVLDFDRTGLEETLEHLWAAQIAAVGAGVSRREARKVCYLGGECPKPAQKLRAAAGKVAVLAVCFPDSGVPQLWAAEEGASGVFLLEEPGEKAAATVVDALRDVPEETARLLSVHWGSNWGYQIPEEQRRFARALLESGAVDLVFGHSSHHPKEVEVYRERAILYGAGDLINDYEGIAGHREYRPELGLLYTVELQRGAVLRLEATPLRRRRFRLEHASLEDARFLARVLSGDRRISEVRVGERGRLAVDLGPGAISP